MILHAGYPFKRNICYQYQILFYLMLTFIDFHDSFFFSEKQYVPVPITEHGQFVLLFIYLFIYFVIFFYFYSYFFFERGCQFVKEQ